MEQTKQMMEMDPARINRDFYYTLALLQYEAGSYIARAEDSDGKLKRAKSIIEQVQKIIKEIEEESEDLATCHPPCYLDKIWGRDCICPHLDTGEDGTHIDPKDLVVVDG